MHMKTIITRLSIFVMAVIISGCGFQLRGSSAKPEYLKHIYVAGQGQYGSFMHELKTKLKSQGVEVVEEAGLADLILTITDEKEEQRVLTITRSDRTAQYQLINTVKFKVTTPGNSEVFPEKVVTAERVYLYDRYAIIGKSFEKEMLQKEMRQDTINQIMIRLYAISDDDIANATTPTPEKEKKSSFEEILN